MQIISVQKVMPIDHLRTADLATATKKSFEQERYGRKAKKVPQELIDQALRNHPLEGIVRWDFSGETDVSSMLRKQFPELMQQLLQTQFVMLADLGITFSNTDAEIRRVVRRAHWKKWQRVPLHVRDLVEAFVIFRDLFRFVDLIIEKGAFSEKHLTSVHTIVSAFTTLCPDMGNALRLLKPIGKQVTFNRTRYIFELPTVLPTSNLAEILLAMPVCFIGNVASGQREDDPFPSKETQYICDAMGSKSSAWFYQMYNRRDRSIETDFVGMPDAIPSDYLEFRKQLSALVDVEVIATPYHFVASKEWRDPSWLAGIDPIAFCIHRGIPYITIFK